MLFTAVGVEAQGSADTVGPLLLTFEKTAIKDGVWKGNVAGNLQGKLRTYLLDFEVLGDIWLVKFDWVVRHRGNPKLSFTARMAGLLNNSTGRVFMQGQIIEGYRTGAQVTEEGWLTDLDSLSFKGTIEVAPAP